ncbi:MAG: magnesium and cobalt transport protein CorA [Flavobacteriia bacterium]|nr:magnesium and cobalt transport protein CorA [Flavobacteriia bacterium]OIP46082.1 MAG: divalent cation transporter [Flavobacteriaceae bacterium CG2_30_31_66]PIV96886.1 MAG: divalent cation transporter [Flavobacteriaceae bacterium CG17_big_fil_post_rev_8_21_14_2_50_31_13]PIX12711.1 MAG: divalent cation transporter [Flavobacteriaceae bacterium CG_4_8_14_3_um_filter_31_8]PIY15193.1 MAG: divalent cation transporter [Flavobacteriaceae bacterium CG_4_10_14_3_um_filter_31_253]PIZ09685.1 MAG: divale
MEANFLNQTSLITYAPKKYEKSTFSSIADIHLSNDGEEIKWLNTYGLNFKDDLKTVVFNSNLDDFLLKLLSDEAHPNKVILLDNLIFLTIRVLKTENRYLNSEQIIFMVSTNFLWSVQEKKGDYFGWIRERIETNKGVVRKKKSDYLLFLLLESIVDNYLETYQKNAIISSETLNITNIKPTPAFTSLVEVRKQELFNFKKATLSLRDVVMKLENIEIKGFNTKYFSELKEQINNLITNIDFELQELESKINLIFSIQGHRLNEVMKTLTILSGIFIPLTFLAGIYGMNFENMPELKFENGYFLLLGIMFVIALLSIWYFRRKRWF